MPCVRAESHSRIIAVENGSSPNRAVSGLSKISVPRSPSVSPMRRSC